MMTMLMNHVMMAAAKAGAFLSCAASNVHTAAMMDATAVASIFAAIIMIISLIIIIRPMSRCGLHFSGILLSYSKSR